MKYIPCNVLKSAAPAMFKAGINPIEVLLWSRSKTLAQVILAVEMVRTKQQIDFTIESGFLMLNTGTNNDDKVEVVRHVQFKEDCEDTMKCPQQNCSFRTSLPKDYGGSYEL